MTDIIDAPEVVSQSDMRRHWWIYYNWIDITEVGDAEIKWRRGIVRPITESVEAANQFDTAWNARRGLLPDEAE